MTFSEPLDWIPRKISTSRKSNLRVGLSEVRCAGCAGEGKPESRHDDPRARRRAIDIVLLDARWWGSDAHLLRSLADSLPFSVVRMSSYDRTQLCVGGMARKGGSKLPHDVR